MYKRREPLSNEPGGIKGEIALYFEERLIRARRGDSVAAAVLAADPATGATRRAPVSGEPRAPYCLMGVCYECLMEIDGKPNQQACMIAACDGMRVRRQDGAPVIAASVPGPGPGRETGNDDTAPDTGSAENVEDRRETTQ